MDAVRNGSVGLVPRSLCIPILAVQTVPLATEMVVGRYV